MFIMRIVGGKYGGHVLVSFNADHIRPTTDRVKQILFDILQGQVEGVRVLDLFSGTGSLGLESLSRGAEFVTFVELNRKSIEILKRNIEKLRIESGFEIKSLDVFKFLKTYSGEPYDLILIDPPFTEVIADKVLAALCQSRVWSSNTVIAIESGKKEAIKLHYEKLTQYNQRDFGDKKLSFYRAEGESK